MSNSRKVSNIHWYYQRYVLSNVFRYAEVHMNRILEH